MEQFKSRIQYLMDAKNFNQTDIAEGIGTHKSRVHEWVKGTIKQPQRKTLRKISNFTGCDFDWLETGQGEPFPQPKSETTKQPTEFQERRKNKVQENELKEMKRLRFKQQCGTVFFDDLFDFVAENYGENQPGVQKFLNELHNTNENFRKWEQKNEQEEEKKQTDENLQDRAADNLSAES